MQHLIRQAANWAFLTLLFATFSYGAWAQQAPKQPPVKVYRLYDNFDQKLIDPAKWSSQYQCDPGSLECVREIVDGHLHLRVRAYGAVDTNVGRQFGVSELFLSAGSSASDIVTEVFIRGTDAQGCITNAGEGAHGQALMFGAFFNGGGGTPADDVQAYLQLDRYSTDMPGVILVGGFWSCQGQYFGNVQVGQVNVGERAIIELVWDRPNHRFIVRLIRPTMNNAITEQSMPYSVPDSTPAAAPFKALSARAFSPNCAGTRTFADMDILFDNVTVAQ